MGAISAVMTKEDAILSDELNHASIIDGCRLSGAKIIRIKHQDMKDLEKKAKEAIEKRNIKKSCISQMVFSPWMETLHDCRKLFRLLKNMD